MPVEVRKTYKKTGRRPALHPREELFSGSDRFLNGHLRARPILTSGRTDALVAQDLRTSRTDTYGTAGTFGTAGTAGTFGTS
jgi:hypothetical protein